MVRCEKKSSGREAPAEREARELAKCNERSPPSNNHNNDNDSNTNTNKNNSNSNSDNKSKVIIIIVKVIEITSVMVIIKRT